MKFYDVEVDDILYTAEGIRFKVTQKNRDNFYALSLDEGDDNHNYIFDMNGFVCHCPTIRFRLYWQTPIFKVPPKPKRVVTKEIVRWANLYRSKNSNEVVEFLYLTKEMAEIDSSPNDDAFIATAVKMVGTYETEE